ncbi:exodeoxyribonuclease VII large subunit [Spirochaetia bacterium 38H-sp]|uniref:Exodeoxyribonuclease 7 large subunit n=1 Tax=Rarispira pelagica TaxID=3141764 RepID=A0ABU9UAW0_9SPIR
MSLPQKTLSVSELTTLIKSYLEDSFPYVCVEGEISNCRPSSSGHLYLSLKDNSALINVVMFSSRLRNLGFSPEDGQKVVVRGAISVYPARGSYQIIAEEMELSGRGDILRIIEERKRRLAEEGLFDSSRKKPIPLVPKTIAVVTSPTGAAIRDIINVLSRRNAAIKIIVVPAPVQGEHAAPVIAEQIRRADAWRLGDVIIVGRGGGSLEDLLPFSEEVVVRAIAECKTPVISAVGHEIDYALSDFAADLRAPTPSAAAEQVSANREELITRIANARSAIENAMYSRIKEYRIRLSVLNPDNLKRYFTLYTAPLAQKLDELKNQLISSMDNRLKDIRHRLQIASAGLSASSPDAILKRGYAIVRDKKTGKILRMASETEKGNILDIMLYRGNIIAITEEVTDGSEKKL